ncbi:hypothetical protein GCM10020258_03080 [Sphingomonas yabuuchiae]
MQDGEVHRLIRADRNPVVDEGARELPAEPARRVEGQVDRRELDMRQRVEQRDPPFSEPPRPRLGMRLGGSNSGRSGRPGASGIATSKSCARAPRRQPRAIARANRTLASGSLSRRTAAQA